VRSLYGRIRPLAGISDRNANIRKAAEREAINMPIQGTASDIVKIAMLRADEAFRREKLDARMLMQVHDELLVECPADAAERVTQTLKREMENAVELDVPLIAETGIGDNWMDAKH
jgi:DNA polymerase I-like protein with 3'-5' exonuclease and polymerase domains